jgi:hypothetical protein
MKLYLDDTRQGPWNDFVHDTDDWKNWVICRSVEVAKVILRTGQVEFMSLDHDMGVDGDGNLLPTGYDLLCWLEENVDIPRPKVVVHSSNTVGRQRMEQVIRKL